MFGKLFNYVNNYYQGKIHPFYQKILRNLVMSFHQQNIEAFIQLLKSQRSAKGGSASRSLFSDQDRANLDQLVAKLPDDEEKISEAIASWYEKHPKILDAQLEILNTLLTDELNASRSIAGAIALAETEAEKDYRKELIDAIRTSAR